MKYTALTFLIISCAIFGAGNAFSCSPAVDQPQLTLHEKAAEAETVFVGRVEAVSDEEVIFTVKDVGSGKLRRETVKPINNTCGIAFSADEVWLYMGSLGGSGTSRLRDEDFGVDPSMIIDRLEPEQAP